MTKSKFVPKSFKPSPELMREIGQFYRVSDITADDVKREYANLARRGRAGIVGDTRREALRDIFARHGADPVIP